MNNRVFSFCYRDKKKRGRKEIEYKYTSALDESHCQDLLTLRFFIVKNNRIISIAPTTMSNLLVTIVFLCSLVGEITSYTCSCIVPVFTQEQLLQVSVVPLHVNQHATCCIAHLHQSLPGKYLQEN